MAKIGYTLKTKDSQHEVSLYPPQQVYITQGYGGTYSHKGTLNLDNASASNLRKIAAPFKCKVVSNQTSGGYGIVIYHSVNKVWTPKGLNHVTLVLMHDNNSSRWSVGNVYNQGQHIYDEGDADPSGLTTGIHVHMEVAFGHHTNRVITESGGRYHIVNQEKIEDVFYTNGADMINQIPLEWTNSQRPYLTKYEGEVLEWIEPENTYLSVSQSLNNAQIIVNYLYVDTKDWSKASISALLGNMRHESTVNPNLYEQGYNWEEDRGFGLVQWTPRSKLWNWATSNNLNPRKGETQLARLDYEVENNIQWIPISRYNYMTFEDFRKNTGGWSVDYLTEAFTWSYERPNASDGEESMANRKSFANRAYNELDWDGTTDPDPDPDPDPQRKDDIMMLYLMDIIKGGY